MISAYHCFLLQPPDAVTVSQTTDINSQHRLVATTPSICLAKNLTEPHSSTVCSFPTCTKLPSPLCQ